MRTLNITLTSHETILKSLESNSKNKHQNNGFSVRIWLPNGFVIILSFHMINHKDKRLTKTKWTKCRLFEKSMTNLLYHPYQTPVWSTDTAITYCIRAADSSLWRFSMYAHVQIKVVRSVMLNALRLKRAFIIEVRARARTQYSTLTIPYSMEIISVSLLDNTNKNALHCYY